MKIVGQGRTADIYTLDSRTILKLLREGFPEGDARVEYEISKYVYELGVSTPRPYDLEEYDGRLGIRYQYLAGHTMLGRMLIYPGQVQEYSRQMAVIHAELHTYDGTGVKRSQKKLLSRQVHDSVYLMADEKRIIQEYLESLPTGTRLCHGDFHPDNIILSESEAPDEKYWIIDWMTGMEGNPAGDAARTLLLFMYGTMPDETPAERVKQFNEVREQLLEIYQQHYLLQSGLDAASIDAWLLPVAAARLCEWIPEEERAALLGMIRERISKL
ncbi:phosphotransferase family protein [Paenibacillus massiliensis]|uniref:phosphotransferase family protein n=1 Tax=Paenibacillus massiliensis TaxID=225917 RepID=UPI0004177B7B|nr:aminoglycoside phosphotransferase family protein [Paenibacillus massiliensis]